MKKDNNESPEIIVPLGKALKDARLMASLSIDEVAEKLNLGPYTVRDLEDELDNILITKKYPVIYLRGYLANYAKLVGLNTLELFVEYQQLECVNKQKKTAASSNFIIPPVKKRAKSLPILLVVIISLIVLFYFFNKPPLTVFQKISSAFETNVETVPQENLTQQSIMTEKVSANSAKHSSTKTEITEAQLDTPKESDKSDDAIKPLVDVDESIVKEIEVTSDVNKVVVKEGVDTVEGASEEASSLDVSESLSLAFKNECWTEVFDATGKRIAYGLYNTGHVLELSGIAPFKLKLGDPSVVDIQYQDQIIDGEFTPGRSAQFSVPLS